MDYLNCPYGVMPLNCQFVEMVNSMKKNNQEYCQFKSIKNISKQYGITQIVAAHLFSLWSARRQNKECAKYK